MRLAAKLTGWRIDIKSEEEKRREVEAQFGALELGEGETAEAGGDGSADTGDMSNLATAGEPSGEPAAEEHGDTVEEQGDAVAEAADGESEKA